MVRIVCCLYILTAEMNDEDERQSIVYSFDDNLYYHQCLGAVHDFRQFFLVSGFVFVFGSIFGLYFDAVKRYTKGYSYYHYICVLLSYSIWCFYYFIYKLRDRDVLWKSKLSSWINDFIFDIPVLVWYICKEMDLRKKIFDYRYSIWRVHDGQYAYKNCTG